jgi:hypothetical protein
MAEAVPYWNSNEEKLLCLMVLDDGAVERMLGPGIAAAYWRGFIVQNRETGVIYCKSRFKHANGDRNWYQVTPEIQNASTMQDLREKFEATFRLAIDITGGDAEKAILCFYPPDDYGDGAKTIIWLEQQDLIEIRVEHQ